MKKLLLSTCKICYKVDNSIYSTGGSPKEFNALAKKFDLYLLTSILDKSKVKDNWEKLDDTIKCFSFGKVIEFSAFPPPVLTMQKSKQFTEQILSNHSIDCVLIKGPSDIGLSTLNTVKSKSIPVIYHYSYDWIDDIIVSSKKNIIRKLLRPYFNFVKKYRMKRLTENLHKADFIATVSSAYIQHLRQFTDKQIVLMRNTFTTSSKDIITKEIQANYPEYRFLYVGRIDYNKNVQSILDSLALVIKELPDTAIKLDIIGDGEYIPILKQKIQELHLINTVNLLGYVNNNNLKKYYQKAYALILTSFSETFGQVILESMTNGTPVIASNVGGIPDIVENNKNGILINPHDNQTITNAVKKIITDRSMYAGMLKQTSAIAEQFSREHTIEEWYNYINDHIDKIESSR